MTISSEKYNAHSSLKSSADAKAIIHSSCSTVLNENTLIFIGDFDGELGELMTELAKLVSGLFFYLCFKMQERATSYYEQLSQLQKLYVAIRATGRSLRKQKLFFATCHGE